MTKKKIVIGILLFGILFLPLVVGAAGTGIQIPKETGLSEDSFAQVLDRVLNWMLMIFVILATMAFVITGLQFIFSFGGASGTQESAKKNFTYTIIAIFIVGGALIILNTVIGLLGDAPAGPVSNPNVDHYGRDPFNNDHQANEFVGSPTNGANNNDHQANEFVGSPTNGANNNDHQANEFVGSPTNGANNNDHQAGEFGTTPIN